MATYDIILGGPLGRQMRALVDEYDLDDVPARVVLCGLSADVATLEAILDRAYALGVAVVRLRRDSDACADPEVTVDLEVTTDSEVITGPEVTTHRRIRHGVC